MSFRDMLVLALGNLRRHKLRVAFTTAGVVIAIATFVALLAFAAGSQRWVSEGFETLGLLTSMNVTPREAESDELAAPLDSAAVVALTEIPGVRLAFPFVDFNVTVTVGDTAVTTRARALPQSAFDMARYRQELGGLAFSEADAHEAILTREFLELVSLDTPDSLIGRRLVVSTRVASLDSAVAALVREGPDRLAELLRSFDADSLRSRGYQQRLVAREIGSGLQRFAEGLLEKPGIVADTLTILGVGRDLEGYRSRLAPVIVPERTARRFGEAGISLDADPAALLTAVHGGRLLGAKASGQTYPQVTLELGRLVDHAAVADSVEALGFEAFSFAQQFEEIQRFYVYFYGGLGVIGVMALVTAALGIANTLVMSVTERRREIGVLKALGTDEAVIRGLFLTESAVIGTGGAVLGIGLGWLGTKLVAMVMRAVMAREGMPPLPYEPFAFPVWLLLLALVFGTLVAVLAGTFPAARAARVDPVEALRSE